MSLTPTTRIALGALTATLALWTANRVLRPGRVDQRAEDVLDQADEGLAIHRPAGREQTNATARFRRTIRWGAHGVEIDAAALGRLRIRRL